MARDDSVLVIQVLRIILLGMMMDTLLLLEIFKNKRRRINEDGSYSVIDKIPDQVGYMVALTKLSHTTALNQLRLGRDSFAKLCVLLKQIGGLTDTRGCPVEDQVAMFLVILGHHKKNRVVFFDFQRSARTVHKHFHRVLQAVLKLFPILIAKPEPVQADSTDDKWKWFKGCLGALDGTYIEVTVSDKDKPRYRSRKGKPAVNVLGVVDRNMNFVYVLTGWEGSAHDGRVLRDAVERANGFKVPIGNYYLCDAGYTNGEGFLAPYRGVRYHLKEWGPGNLKPQNPKELFNLRHSKARNCIERAFGILKARWAILRSQSFYKIDTQNDIILACCLLHNYCRMEMAIDPIEVELRNQVFDDDYVPVLHVPHVQTSPEWTTWRDNLANGMYQTWRH